MVNKSKTVKIIVFTGLGILLIGNLGIMLLQGMGFYPINLGIIVSPDNKRKIILSRAPSDPADWIDYQYEITPTGLFEERTLLGTCTSNRYDKHELVRWKDNQHFIIQIHRTLQDGDITKEFTVNTDSAEIPCDESIVEQ